MNFTILTQKELGIVRGAYSYYFPDETKKKRIKFINEIGYTALPTDFCFLNKAYPDSLIDYQKNLGYVFKNSENEVVNTNYDNSYNSSWCVRPVIQFESSEELESFLKDKFIYDAINNYPTIVYGSYPQTLANDKLQFTLDILKNRLDKTGNVYDIHNLDDKPLEEYEYNDKRYVNIKYDTVVFRDFLERIKEKDKLVFGHRYWVRVEPIVWYIDYETKKLICTNLILTYNMSCNKKFDDFLNENFALDILKSDTKIDSIDIVEKGKSLNVIVDNIVNNSLVNDDNINMLLNNLYINNSHLNKVVYDNRDNLLVKKNEEVGKYLTNMIVLLYRISEKYLIKLLDVKNKKNRYIFEKVDFNNLETINTLIKEITVSSYVDKELNSLILLLSINLGDITECIIYSKNIHDDNYLKQQIVNTLIIIYRISEIFNVNLVDSFKIEEHVKRLKKND